MTMLHELFSIIQNRRDHPTDSSYTAHLFAGGQDLMLKKVGEETMEVILAAKGEGDQRLIEEVADLFYHTLVLLAGRGISLEDIEDELRQRHMSRQASS